MIWLEGKCFTNRQKTPMFQVLTVDRSPADCIASRTFALHNLSQSQHHSEAKQTHEQSTPQRCIVNSTHMHDTQTCFRSLCTRHPLLAAPSETIGNLCCSSFHRKDLLSESKFTSEDLTGIKTAV